MFSPIQISKTYLLHFKSKEFVLKGKEENRPSAKFHLRNLQELAARVMINAMASLIWYEKKYGKRVGRRKYNDFHRAYRITRRQTAKPQKARKP